MPWTNGYTRTSTAAHKRWAAQVKANAGYHCQAAGCARRADVADHIRPVAEGGAEFDVANGQALCKAHHDVKTQGEAARGRARRQANARRPAEQHPGVISPGA